MDGETEFRLKIGIGQYSEWLTYNDGDDLADVISEAIGNLAEAAAPPSVVRSAARTYRITYDHEDDIGTNFAQIEGGGTACTSSYDAAFQQWLAKADHGD